MTTQLNTLRKCSAKEFKFHLVHIDVILPVALLVDFKAILFINEYKYLLRNTLFSL